MSAKDGLTGPESQDKLGQEDLVNFSLTKRIADVRAKKEDFEGALNKVQRAHEEQALFLRYLTRERIELNLKLQKQQLLNEASLQTDDVARLLREEDNLMHQEMQTLNQGLTEVEESMQRLRSIRGTLLEAIQAKTYALHVDERTLFMRKSHQLEQKNRRELRIGGRGTLEA